MTKSKNILLILGIIVVAGLAFFLLTQGEKRNDDTSKVSALGDDIGEILDTEIAANEADNIEHALAVNEGLADAKMEVIGASPVTPDNVVVTFEGKPTDNSAAPASELAPKRTMALDKETLPPTVKLLNASRAGFSPSEFTAKAGEPTTIAISSTDELVHVFKFDDASLNAVMVGVMPGETKAITFNAPVAGTYHFHCDVPEHQARGEVGLMIVE